MQQTKPNLPLLLGFAGWPQPAWQEHYFPDDLPEDWQFAYYSNEASCLLLPAEDWQALDAETVEDWCDDAPEHFRFYLHGPAPFAIEPFARHLGAVLVADKTAMPGGLTCYYPDGQGHWLNAQDEIKLLCLPWQDDLRALRKRLQALPTSIEAIIFTPGGTPRQLADVRTLTELLGF